MSAQAEPDEPAIVQLRSVTQREIDYEDLTKVDQLVRDVVAGRTSLRDARGRDRADRLLRTCPGPVGGDPRVRV